MKKKDTNKEEDFIDYLDSLITLAEKEAQKQKRENKSKEFSELLTMLESLRYFISDLAGFYYNTDVNKIITWEQILTCLNFMKDVLFSVYFGKKGEMFSIDAALLKKFLAFIYEKKYWGKNDWVPSALSDNMNILLLFYFPNDFLKKIILPQKTLTIINYSLFKVCQGSHNYKLGYLLKSLYKETKFLYEFNAWFIIFDFFSESKALERFNKKNKRVITWEECNSLLKEKLKLIDNLFDKNNWKVEPNKKYHEEMFEFVNQKRLEGLKCYVAYQQTLEKYGFNPDKEDSFRKQYNAYLKKKEVNFLL